VKVERKVEAEGGRVGGKGKERLQVLWAKGGRGLARACKVVKLERPGDGKGVISNVDQSAIKD